MSGRLTARPSGKFCKPIPIARFLQQTYTLSSAELYMLAPKNAVKVKKAASFKEKVTASYSGKFCRCIPITRFLQQPYNLLSAEMYMGKPTRTNAVKVKETRSSNSLQGEGYYYQFFYKFCRCIPIARFMQQPYTLLSIEIYHQQQPSRRILLL